MKPSSAARALGLTNWRFVPSTPRSTSWLSNQQPGRRGQPEPPPPPGRRSRQRQTLSSPVWEGSRRCFHFISYSSRTVSHRHEKPREKLSPSPTTAPQKQGTWGVEVKGTPWTSGSRGSLPQQRPAWGKQQEARTTTSWHGDLGPATNALGLHFFSPSVKWR